MTVVDFGSSYLGRMYELYGRARQGYPRIRNHYTLVFECDLQDLDEGWNWYVGDKNAHDLSWRLAHLENCSGRHCR